MYHLVKLTFLKLILLVSLRAGCHELQHKQRSRTRRAGMWSEPARNESLPGCHCFPNLAPLKVSRFWQVASLMCQIISQWKLTKNVNNHDNKIHGGFQFTSHLWLYAMHRALMPKKVVNKACQCCQICNLLLIWDWKIWPCINGELIWRVKPQWKPWRIIGSDVPTIWKTNHEIIWFV